MITAPLYGQGRRFFLIAIVGCLALLALPGLGLNGFWTREIVLIGILALATSGLNLSFGYAGELALGQAAIYAGGAYAAAILSVRVTGDLLVGLVAGIIAGLLLGLVTGIPGLRLGGWTLAIASFFLVILIPDIVQIFSSFSGGQVGLSLPVATILGKQLSPHDYYYFVIVVGAIWLICFRNLVLGRFGGMFRTLSESPTLASSQGISVYQTKLLAYTLGAVPAGMAGVLFAHTDSYISPSAFTLATTLAFLAASILGGSKTVYGPLVGAVIMQEGPLRAASYANWSLVIFGSVLLIGGVLLSGGLSDVFTYLARRIPLLQASDSGAVAANLPAEFPHLDGAALEVIGVEKSFGGNRALRGVDLSAHPGRVTALIGPNGSGKTTLLNLMSRFYEPDAGILAIDGNDLQALRSWELAATGITRTFQTPIIPRGLAALDVVALGRLSQSRCSAVSAVLRLPKYRHIQQEDARIAAEALESLGLGHVALQAAHTLPLGTRRMLEVARALAARPRVILLDEPAAGMDEDELVQLRAVVRRLADAGATVVIVEHNFRLVLDVADDIYVLAQGAIIATGPPDFIRAHPDVIAHYLGEAVGAPARRSEPEA
jgi:branched-chain amino acid transport system permease protein